MRNITGRKEWGQPNPLHRQNRLKGQLIVLIRIYFYFLIVAFPLQSIAWTFDGVRALVHRRVPWLDHHILFVKISQENSLDVFTLQTKNETLIIKASDANAGAVGLNWYLKYYCHRSMSHMGDNLAAVFPLPVVKEPVKINATVQYRYALNYCTFNYTMSFYTWKEWEHELDWMALNGVNLMLVANGEEIVWESVLKRLGYSKNEINDFIPGPAYNAWWLMGNLQGWGGPMPQSQINSRKNLVQKMIARMQSLGIEPVMPGFYGMAPSDLKTKTNAHIVPQGKWSNFTRPDILDPTDTAFERIAGFFYEETKKIYGGGIRFFSGDPFHEGGKSQDIDLGKAGAEIQKAMQTYFSGATWVLQGWQKNPDEKLLTNLDKSKTLILELSGENTHNWEIRKGYEGTPFIWGIVNNFGGKPGPQANLERFASEAYRVRHSIYSKYLKGVGIIPEGIDNNPVAYKLLLATAWSCKLNVDQWVNSYIVARYGKRNEDIKNAWKLFMETVYRDPGFFEGPPENVLCARPALQIKSASAWGTLKKNYDIKIYEEGVRLFAKAAPLFPNSNTYKIDLIDFTRQVLSNRADSVFKDFVNAYNEKNTGAFKQAANRFLALAGQEDSLLGTNKFYRLSTYQQQAIDDGKTVYEKKNNLLNLMMLITYWGGNDRKMDILHEYAYREWSGMMNDFYKRRWEIYFNYLLHQMKGEQPDAPDFFSWERKWVNEHLFIIKDQKNVSLEKDVKRILNNK